MFTAGTRCTLEITAIVGSTDHITLLDYYNQQTNPDSFATLPFITGTYTKYTVNGNNVLTTIGYTLNPGIIQKAPEITSDASGEISQMLCTWMLTFGYTPNIS